MNMVKNILLMCFLAFPSFIFSAALKIYTAAPTQVTLFFDDATHSERTVIVEPRKPFRLDRFFGGFWKIQWVNPENGILYEVALDIPGNKGWHTFRIVRKTLTIEYGMEIETYTGNPRI